MREERRKHIRLKTKLSTSYKDARSGKMRRALTKNIGAGGLCLLTEEYLAPGTRLVLELQLSDRPKAIQCQVEVIWSQPLAAGQGVYQNEMGVEFVQIDPKEQTLLTQYARIYGWSEETGGR